jgi:hypothetical protein
MAERSKSVFTSENRFGACRSKRIARTVRDSGARVHCAGNAAQKLAKIVQNLRLHG